MSDLELEQAEAVLEGLGADELDLRCIFRAFSPFACKSPLVGINGSDVWCPRCGSRYPFVVYVDGKITMVSNMGLGGVIRPDAQ